MGATDEPTQTLWQGLGQRKHPVRPTFHFHGYLHPNNAFSDAFPLHQYDPGEVVWTSSQDASLMAPWGGIMGTSDWKAAQVSGHISIL